MFVAGNWLAWFSALQVGSVVSVVPLANVYPLFVVSLSYSLIRERPRSSRFIGEITGIVVGASLI